MEKTIKESNKMNNQWRLKSIEINFKHGYDFEKDPVKKKDRYEGMIRFENGDNESFSFMVRPEMANRYIELIASDIVLAADSLGQRLKESLGLD